MTLRLDRHIPEPRRIAYALGDGSPADRSRVAEHLMACAACRREVEAVTSLAAHARAVPLEAAPPGAFQRILTDRRPAESEGDSVLNRRTTWRQIAAGTIAAGLLLAALPLLNRPQSDIGPEAGGDLLAVIGSPIAFAQTPAGPLSGADVERARQLRGGTWTYRHVTASAATGKPLLVEESILVSGGEQPVIVAHRRAGVGAWTDTLTIDPLTLTPLRFVLRRNPMVWSETRIDAGRVTHSYPTRVNGGPIVRHVGEALLPPALSGKPFLITTDRALPFYVRGLPLQRGAEFRIGALWTKASAPEFSVTAGAVVLRVVGEESVQVPAGKFDAWKLIMEWPGDMRRELWVAKGSQVLLLDRLTGPGRRTYEVALEAGDVH